MTAALQQAISLHRSGRTSEALAHYEAALGASPNELAALFYGGVAAWSEQLFPLALERLSRLIELSAQPSADAHYHRALVHSSLGNEALAIGDYERTIEINPRFAQALNNLGELKRKTGDLLSATSLFARALEANPQLHEARLNTGIAAQQIGDLTRARATLADCVKHDADSLRAREALIHVLLDLSLQSDALTLARASVKRNPKSGALWNALGQAEQFAGNIDAARAAYARGLLCEPALAPLAFNAAHLENENADTAGAEDIYRRLDAAVKSAGASFRLATILPAIPNSEAAIDIARSDFVERLVELKERKLSLLDPLNEFGDTPFYLSYHGREDDHRLLGLLSDTLRQASPALNFRAQHIDEKREPGKWRIGFCSHFLFDQSVGRAVHAFIRGLPRSEFEVHVLRTPPFYDDTLAHAIDNDCNVHRLPFDLNAARNHIAALKLDAIIYPEIGMDSLTYFLAQSRLARVQWTTLGHPCTSGLDTIDAYLSYAALETESSEQHYSETLVRLPEGSIYPDYPSVPPPTKVPNRKELGLSDASQLYICPQSLFKLMPRFDAALNAILQAKPNAIILLPESKMPGQTKAIQARLSRALGNNLQRVKFFPRRTRAEFVALVAACDVVLDPFPVGGGITTWDALATGTPIVTLSSNLMRSRFALSALKSADATELIAQNLEDYVRIALRVGEEKPLCESVRSKLREAAPAIYSDKRAVPHFVSALSSALAQL